MYRGTLLRFSTIPSEKTYILVGGKWLQVNIYSRAIKAEYTFNNCMEAIKYSSHRLVMNAVCTSGCFY
jgi:hypothetical protein